MKDKEQEKIKQLTEFVKAVWKTKGHDLTPEEVKEIVKELMTPENDC